MNRQSGNQHWTRRRPDLVRRGTQGNGAKLGDADVEAICRYYQGGARQTWLARKFNVSRVTIWRHLSAAGLIKA